MLSELWMSSMAPLCKISIQVAKTDSIPLISHQVARTWPSERLAITTSLMLRVGQRPEVKALLQVLSTPSHGLQVESTSPCVKATSTAKAAPDCVSLRSMYGPTYRPSQVQPLVMQLTSRRMATKLSSVWDGMQQMVQRRKSMRSRVGRSLTRFRRVVPEDVHQQTTTSAGKTTASRGRPMESTSPKHLAETTRDSTFGRATSTRTTMVGTPPTKATVRSMNSQMMAHSGQILMGMDMATTLPLHSTLTNVHLSSETQPWTDLAVLMLMAMVTQTKTTGRRATKSSGLIQMATAMVTTISTT